MRNPCDPPSSPTALTTPLPDLVCRHFLHASFFRAQPGPNLDQLATEFADPAPSWFQRAQSLSAPPQPQDRSSPIQTLVLARLVRSALSAERGLATTRSQGARCSFVPVVSRSARDPAHARHEAPNLREGVPPSVEPQFRYLMSPLAFGRTRPRSGRAHPSSNPAHASSSPSPNLVEPSYGTRPRILSARNPAPQVGRTRAAPSGSNPNPNSIDSTPALLSNPIAHLVHTQGDARRSRLPATPPTAGNAGERGGSPLAEDRGPCASRRSVGEEMGRLELALSCGAVLPHLILLSEVLPVSAELETAKIHKHAKCARMSGLGPGGIRRMCGENVLRDKASPRRLTQTSAEKWSDTVSEGVWGTEVGMCLTT